MLATEVAEKEGYSLRLASPTGTSLLIEGKLKEAPKDKEQVSL